MKSRAEIRRHSSGGEGGGGIFLYIGGERGEWKRKMFFLLLSLRVETWRGHKILLLFLCFSHGRRHIFCIPLSGARKEIVFHLFLCSIWWGYTGAAYIFIPCYVWEPSNLFSPTNVLVFPTTTVFFLLQNNCCRRFGKFADICIACAEH